MIGDALLGEAVRFGAATLVRSAIVVVIGAAIAAALGRRASRASSAWTIVFFTIVLLPAMTWMLPAWNVSALDVQHDTLVATRGGLSVAAWICLAWFAGAALLLIRLVRDVIAANRLAARARVVDTPRIARSMDRAKKIVGAIRTPVALETNELASAGLIGWRRPRVLLPVAARNWSDDELLGVLCHELEHVRRNDWIMLLVERVVVALFWINPLVFFAARSAAGAREIVADDAVARAPIGLDVYADRLIATARSIGASPAPAAALGFANGGRVDVRVRALFETRRDRRPMSARAAAMNFVIALPLAIGIASAQPWGCVPPEAAPSTITP